MADDYGKDRNVKPRKLQRQREDYSVVKAMRVFANMLNRRSRSRSESRGVVGGRRGRVLVPHGSRGMPQQVVVKVFIGKRLRANMNQLDYIVREGKGKDGSRPEVFGSITMGEMRKRAPHDYRQPRIILSPELGSSLDMKAYTEAYMRRVSEMKGESLKWIAVVHYDTGKPHAHIIISPNDNRPNGKMLFTRDEVSLGLRELASEVATDILGYHVRTEGEILAKQQSLSYLSSDRILFDLSALHGGIPRALLATLPDSEASVRQARLLALKEQGLVHFDATSDAFYFVEGAEATLRANQRYMSFRSATTRAHYSDAKDVRVWAPGSSDRVGRTVPDVLVGVVTAVGRIDEHTDGNYVLIETLEGSAFYVPLVDAPRVRAGELARIQAAGQSKGRLTPRIQALSTDEVADIARVRREKGGVLRGFGATIPLPEAPDSREGTQHE